MEKVFFKSFVDFDPTQFKVRNNIIQGKVVIIYGLEILMLGLKEDYDFYIIIPLLKSTL